MIQNELRNKTDLQNTTMMKSITRMEGHSVYTFWSNEKSHIPYVGEIKVKDKKVQQKQRGGNKNLNPF